MFIRNYDFFRQLTILIWTQEQRIQIREKFGVFILMRLKQHIR